MCRLLYLPPRAPRKKKILVPLMEQLVESYGGDGCGFATAKSGFVKGVALTPEACAEDMCRTKTPILWHTRKASCGAKTDDLCHPFSTDYGWLAHNGHWSRGAFAASLMKGTWSDSAVAALFIRLYGWKKFAAEADSGVWLHLTRDGCQVRYASGSLYIEVGTGALCSEPAEKWGRWDRVETGTYDANERVKVAKWTYGLAAVK